MQENPKVAIKRKSKDNTVLLINCLAKSEQKFLLNRLAIYESYVILIRLHYLSQQTKERECINMTGSIFDLEGMFRSKDREWLKYKLEKFVSNQKGILSSRCLREFLGSNEIQMLKKMLSLSDADLTGEIQLIAERLTDQTSQQISQIISCEFCGKRLRLYSPLQKGIYSCPECQSEFRAFQFGAEIFTVFSGHKKITHNKPDLEPYNVLGIDYGASLEEVKNAYRKKMHSCHPDKVSEMAPEIKKLAEDMAKKINQAYKKILEEKSPEVRSVV